MNYMRNGKIFLKLRPAVLKYFCSENISAGPHNFKDWRVKMGLEAGLG